MEIIKRKTDYALRALVNLCNLEKGDSKSVRVVSEECEIPEIFLRKIFQKLSAAGIVESNQGPKGGYFLKKDPKSISILEVIEKLQGKFAINKCFLGKTSCPREKKCELKGKLVGVQQNVLDFFNGITLDALASESRDKIL
ncbi:Rrf2 family transcriptional regulator [Candidatus Poribacteria bacterium]|nr:Rrf2 family transcriptional regulator [Candidatus Poribacteria bacterium]